MKTKLLGRTGISVSELCFGTMSFGGDADEATSASMYKNVRDAGINFFDTADEYSKGKSEEILGRLIKGHRDELVIATKCNSQQGPDVNARGTSRRHVVRAVDASLKRLGTDRLDILFLHRFDALTPIEESMRALEDVVRAGKVIYPAVSNWSAWQTQRGLDIQERSNWARLQVIQPMYSLVKRQAEVEILPMAEANGIGVIPYSPARRACCRASISARRQRTRGAAEDQQDVRGALQRRLDVRGRRGICRLLQGARPAPGQHGDRLGRSHPAVTAPIIGARNTDQLKDSLDAIKIDMTPSLRQEIADLSRTKPPPARIGWRSRR
jgi:aryl-alcohol dehydrogenase-like predicted oxidoreductase